MTKKSLIVLSLCLLLGAGFAVYVWANGCCSDESTLCDGGAVRVPETDCDWAFYVHHDRDSWDSGHQIYVYIQEEGEPTPIRYLTNLQTPGPQPVCMLFSRVVTMSANTEYSFWFECLVGEEEEQCDYDGDYTLALDSNCDKVE